VGKYNIIISKQFYIMLECNMLKSNYYTINYINKVLIKIANAIAMLKTFHYATPSVKFKDKPGEYRKYVINNRFLIIYKIEQNNVYLLYFVDARMRYENYFKIHVE